MRNLFNWKYTILILFLLGSLNSMPISNDKSLEDKSREMEISFNNSINTEIYQGNKKNDFSEKDNVPTKNIYMENSVKLTNNVNKTEIEPNKIIPKVSTSISQDSESSNDKQSKQSRVIVDDNNTIHNSNKKGLNNSNNNNNNNLIKKGKKNTETEENDKIINNENINQNFNSINQENFNNNNDSFNTEENIKSYNGGPDNSNLNSNESSSFEDMKKAIYASGVVMGILLFFVVGNFVMRVKASYKNRNRNPPSDDGSLSIDSYEIGSIVEDVKSIYSLETMEQYSDDNQAYVIDNENNKKNIAKIYEIKGLKDHIFTRPSDINRDDSFDSLFRLSSTNYSTNSPSINTTISTNESFSY